MARSRQVREIRVRADVRGARGLRSLSRNLGRVRKDVGGLSRTVGGLRTAFSAIAGFSFAGLGLSSLVRASDDIQLLRDRIAGLEGDATLARQRLDGLAEVAGRTGARIEDLSTIYARLGVALGDTGISGEGLLEVTEVLRNTFRLFGASAAEATGATIQLAQGLASGQFRGQELRSVLEANAEIGTLLARQFEGIGRGELIKFSEERGGFTTAEVLTALAEGQEEVNAKAEKLNLTIEQGLSKALNDLKLSLLDVNTELGVSEKVVNSLTVAADNLGLAIASLGTIGLFVSLRKIASSRALATIIQRFRDFARILSAVGRIAGTGGAIAIALKFLGGAVALKAAAVLGTIAAVLGAVAFGLNKVDPDKFNQIKLAITNFVTGTENLTDRVLVDIDKTFGEGGDIIGPVKGTGDQFKETFKEMGLATEQVVVPLRATGDQVSALQKDLDRLKNKGTDEAITSVKALNQTYKELNEDNIDEYISKLKDIRIAQVKSKAETGDLNRLQEQQKIAAIESGKALGFQKNQLAAYNEAISSSSISVREYSSELRKSRFKELNQEFAEGRINAQEFSSEISSLRIEKLRSDLAAGEMTLSELNEEINKNRIEQLNFQFQSGTISLRQYDEELNSIAGKFRGGSVLRQGTRDYLEESGTLAQNIAGSITLTFNTLEDTLVEFTKSGRLNFQKFTEAILEDLNRIIIRATIIRPLAQGLLGAVGIGGATGSGAVPSFQSNPSFVAAQGGVFGPGGVVPFANGGIVSSPSLFGFGRNRTGLMGEEGPEAIVPLRRTSTGDLGVQATPPNVNVNIINNSDARIEQRETTDQNGQRSIDVIVNNAVRKGFANGAFDRQLNQQYGIRRKGY